MKKIEVFDPALCCSTGVCGPSPDQYLIEFASVAKVIEGEGKAVIQRYNLAQQPTAFSLNPIIQRLLQEDGIGSLPAILIEGKLVMKGVYPSKEQLERLLNLSSNESGCCDSEESQGACCSPAASASSEQDGASCCC